MSRPNIYSTDEQREMFAKNIKDHVGKESRITAEVIAKEWYGVEVKSQNDYAFVRSIVHWLRVNVEIVDKRDESRVRALCADDDGYFLAKNSIEAFRYGSEFHKRNQSQIRAEEAIWEGADEMLRWEDEHEQSS